MKKGKMTRREMMNRQVMERVLERAKEEALLNPSIKTIAEVQTLTRIVKNLK